MTHNRQGIAPPTIARRCCAFLALIVCCGSCAYSYRRHPIEGEDLGQSGVLLVPERLIRQDLLWACVKGFTPQAIRKMGAATRPRPFTPVERDELSVLERRLQALDPSHPHWVEYEFARARLLSNARVWDKAIPILRTLATDHPNTAIGLAAAKLFLLGLARVSVVVDSDHACYEEMIQDVPLLSAAHCNPESMTATPSQCVTLWEVEMELRRWRTDQAVRKADQSPTDSRAQYASIGERYLGLYQWGCEPPHPFHGRCEELTYEAAACFLAGRETARAQDLLRLMRGRWPSSPFTRRLACKLTRSRSCH